MNEEKDLLVDGDDRRRELDYIQDIIKRMSIYQMTIKVGVIILSAFFTSHFLREGSSDFLTVLVLFIFNIFFLKIARRIDLKFLITEKLYRSWFSFVVESRESTREHLFELNPEIISNVLETQGMKSDDFKDEIEKRSKKSWAINGIYNTLFYIFLIFFVYSCF